MGEYSISHAEVPSPDEERAIHLGIARGDPPDAGPRPYGRLSWIARAPDGSFPRCRRGFPPTDPQAPSATARAQRPRQSVMRFGSSTS